MKDLFYVHLIVYNTNQERFLPAAIAFFCLLEKNRLSSHRVLLDTPLFPHGSQDFSSPLIRRESDFYIPVPRFEFITSATLGRGFGFFLR